MGRLGALLRPTWQSYAGLPPEEGAFCRLAAAALPLAAKTKQPGFARWKCTPSAYGTSPRESMSLDFRVVSLPYSTAITDSLDSQVATASLRIQFAGVTPVPLPPRRGAQRT